MLQARLDGKTRFAFGAGAMPETLKNTAWDTFVLFYFTQVLGMSGALAGLAIAIALVVDAVIDPSIGSFSDGMGSSKMGRRQKLMAFSILPFGISFILLFAAPTGLGDYALFVWLIFFAVICRSAISLFTIPYYALGVELSRNALERPLLASFRQVSTAIGRFGLPFIAFTFFFAASPQFPNGQLNRAAYIPFAATLSVISMLLMAWCVYGTRRRSLQVEAQDTAPVAAPISIVVTVRQILQAFRCTRNIRWQVGVGVFMFASLSILNVLTLHLTTYYWRLTPEQIRNVSMALAPGTLLSALLARYYVPFFDKRRIMITAITLYGLVVLVPILGPMTGFFPASGDPMQVTLLVTFKFLGGIAYGAFLVTSATVASDVADELELNAGAPRQALMSSFTFFTFSAASAVVNVLAGLFLDLLAFPVGSKVGDVPVAMAEHLAIFTGVIILVSVSFVLLCVSKLDISVAKQNRINGALEERYAAARTAQAEALSI